jgi:glycosyltransferase involved in cell wall biosynthesis
MSPLVTIGITAFNSDTSVVKAIRSALSQRWDHLQVLVVDDASTDRTFELARQISQSDHRVRVLRHHANLGVAAARNTIIANAADGFLAFFDDDDESDANRVTEQWLRITEYEKRLPPGSLVVCHTARAQDVSGGSVWVEKTMGCDFNAEAPHGPAVAARILWGRPLKNGYGAVATCSQMARTSTYRTVGGFDPMFRRSEDTEFCVKLAMAGGHFVGLDQPLVRQTLTRRSGKTLSNELFYKRMLLDKYKHLATSEAEYDFSRRWLELKTNLHRSDRMKLLTTLAAIAFSHPVLMLGRLSQVLPRFPARRSIDHFQRSEGL